jgi:Leucine-rich repeat (LRR) protein
MNSSNHRSKHKIANSTSNSSPNKKRRISIKHRIEHILPFDCWLNIVECCDMKTWWILQLTSQLFYNMKYVHPLLAAVKNKQHTLNFKFNLASIPTDTRHYEPIGIVSFNRNPKANDNFLSLFRNVTKLDVSHTKVTNLGLEQLQQLVELDCSHCRVSPDLFKHLPSLKILNVEGCSKISNKLGKYIASVTDLNIGQTTVDDRFFKDSLKSDGTLTKLNISKCTRVSESGIATEECRNIQCLSIDYCHALKRFNFISCLSMLTSLSIAGIDVRDADLVKIQNSMITTLDISNCLYITQDGFQYFNNIVHLRMKQMSGYIHGDVFQYLKSLKSLAMEIVTPGAVFTFDHFQSINTVELLIIPSYYKWIINQSMPNVKITWI